MENKSIPFYAHESMMTRMERTIRRLWILCIVLILLLAGTNAAWLWYENSFEDVVTTNEITQDVNSDGGGDAIVNDGVHINGKSTANGEDND